MLDIGFGTGVLTNKLYKDGANIFGVDFSKKMIDIAHKKMPKATLVNWDFSMGIAPNLKLERFDYIIASYSIHHLDDDKKNELITSLIKLLNKDGKIIIADVAFKIEKDLVKCKSDNIMKWDNSEIYIVADKIINFYTIYFIY